MYIKVRKYLLRIQCIGAKIILINQLYIILINLNMYSVCGAILNTFYMFKMVIHAVN